MVTISRLKDIIPDDRDFVVIPVTGEPVSFEVPKDIGPATLFVAPVTDALKTVSDDGLVDRSLDRDSVWAIDALALNRVVLHRLEDDTATFLELIEKVAELGFSWQIRVSDPATQ